MSFSNAWDETTPVGATNASEADNFFRKHRLDLGERLEDIFYGFNASDNSDQENEVGVKNLKMYREASDPSTVTDYGHLYVKLVSGVPELFFQDDTNTTLQLTSGGRLYSSSTFESVGVATLADGSLTKTSAAPTTDAMIVNKKFIDDQIGNESDGHSIPTTTGYQFFDVNGVSTKVYTKYLTGNTAGGGSQNIPHGLTDGDDILSVTFAVRTSGSYKVLDNNSDAETSSSFRILWDDTNVQFNNRGTAMDGVHAYRIKIDYIP